ncbi:hypothetical protein [Micromonospora marina]|uniref:hypothetical protein n=1 Tax=Micromonospora marina TaxID=307120 RepID=UPI003CC5DE22
MIFGGTLSEVFPVCASHVRSRIAANVLPISRDKAPPARVRTRLRRHLDRRRRTGLLTLVRRPAGRPRLRVTPRPAPPRVQPSQSR